MVGRVIVPAFVISYLTRMIHESATPNENMAALPVFLGSRILRRTVQVRLRHEPLRLPDGTPIFFTLAALRSVPQEGSQFGGLATAVHEISGLGLCRTLGGLSPEKNGDYHEVDNKEAIGLLTKGNVFSRCLHKLLYFFTLDLLRVL